MAVHYIRPNIAGELRDPLDCDEQVVKALEPISKLPAAVDPL